MKQKNFESFLYSSIGVAAMFILVIALYIVISALKIGADAVINSADEDVVSRLIELHGDDLRFVHAWGKWLTWTGERWA